MNRLVPIKTVDVDSIDNLTLCQIKVVRNKKKQKEKKKLFNGWKFIIITKLDVSCENSSIFVCLL